MKEVSHSQEPEPEQKLVVRSPYNQLALFEAVWMYTAAQGKTLDEITANPAQFRTNYEVSKKLVRGYIGLHETDPLLKPPNMFQWSILGMPAEDALVVPGHLAKDVVYQYQDRASESTFTDPEEIDFLYRAADVYLNEHTRRLRGANAPSDHFMNTGVIPLRAQMQELASANGIEITPELQSRWGIEDISNEVESFLRSLDE